MNTRSKQAQVLGACLLAVVALVGSLVVSASSASALTGTLVTKDLTLPAPPSTSFAGASSGDGWDVLFNGARVYNVFHHNASNFQIDCHLQADGSHCDGTAWPKTITDTSGATTLHFTTPAHASGVVDQATNQLYGWTSRIETNGTQTPGVVCVDLTSTSSDPFCGFTPLGATGSGKGPSGYTALGGRVVVGNRMYSPNPVRSTSSGSGANALLCFDLTTLAPCANQPFGLNLGSASIGSDTTGDNVLGAGGYVFSHIIATSGSVVDCFDPSTGAECSGSWPRATSVGQGLLFSYLDATGTAVGVCLSAASSLPCWNFDASTKTTPASLQSAVGAGTDWNDGTSIGTRIFLPSYIPSDHVYCYDFATATSCSAGLPSGTRYDRLHDQC